MENEERQEKGVIYLTDPNPSFEEIYARVRNKEKRWLSDDLVKQLPYLAADHVHYQEWQKRSKSLKRILKILKSEKTTHLLEVGCGNGWCANQLISMVNQLDALDVVKEELEQAVRCFKNEKIRFICCNDLSLLENGKYDVILFNASIQYFEVTDLFWSNLFLKLSKQGKIIIMDSPIYDVKEVSHAKVRSEQYFRNINEDDASLYYKHITWQKLPQFKVIYKYSRFRKFFIFNTSPFPIIQIRNEIK